MQPAPPSIYVSPTPRPPWSPTVERIAVLAFWAFFTALELLRRTLDPFRPDVLFGPMAYTVLASFVVWVLLTPVIFELARRLPLEHGAAMRRLAAHFGIGLIVAVLVKILTFALIGLLMRDTVPPNAPVNLSALGPADVILRLWFLDALVIYLAVLAIGFARNYFIRLRWREQEAARLEAEAAGLQAQLADARLSALRMQLNPHFLFNTLHTVSSLADEDPEGVQRIVARLSALLRRVLEGTARQEVPLSEEISFLRDYLEIQRVRFQGRLEVSEEIDAEVLDALVPNLILQPLVENAVKHGAGQTTNAVGRIVLSAHCDSENGHLVLVVRDNGPGLAEGAEAEAVRAGRVGLANTRQRLDALYGSYGTLDLAAAPEGGLTATVTIPYHTAEDLRAAVNV